MVPKRLGAVMLTLGFLSSCTAPQYDDQVDKLITQLQTDVTSEFTTLITQDEKIGDLAGATDKASQAALAKAQAAAGYEANTDAYDKIAIDLVLLKTRVANEPNWGTGHVADALDLLMQQLSGPIGATAPAGTCGGGNPASSMRSVHKACGTLSIDYLVEKYGIISGELNLLVLYDVTIKNGQATSGGSGGGAAPAGAKK